MGAKNGFAEIKEHPLFSGFDFDALLAKKLPAPYKPKLKDTLDAGNFYLEFTSEDVVTSAIPEKNLEFIKRNQDNLKSLMLSIIKYINLIILFMKKFLYFMKFSWFELLIKLKFKNQKITFIIKYYIKCLKV